MKTKIPIKYEEFYADVLTSEENDKINGDIQPLGSMSPEVVRPSRPEEKPEKTKSSPLSPEDTLYIKSNDPTIGYLLITLNHPPTKTFEQAPSNIQKTMYKKLWLNMQNIFGIPQTNNYVFEYCQNGRVHLHGILSIHVKQFHIMGLISDYVKAYLNQLSKRYDKFYPNCLYIQYQRYKSPSITVQYKPYGDPYIKTWEEYMLKNQ